MSLATSRAVLRALSEIILPLATALERGSAHPLGEAIVEGAETRGAQEVGVSGFITMPAHGVSGEIEGRQALHSNAKLMRDRGVVIDPLVLLGFVEALAMLPIRDDEGASS